MIKDQPGDAYFVRSMFDRNPVDDYGDPPHLSFVKDDILYIDNTMYNGVPGNWSAWSVNQEGKTTQWGIIPSKYKVSRSDGHTSTFRVIVSDFASLFRSRRSSL